jgi:HEAT repeat protein
LLVHTTGGVVDRVRVQSPVLPIELGGGTLYWLNRVADDQSFALGARCRRTRQQRADPGAARGEHQLHAQFAARDAVPAATFRGNGSTDVRRNAAEGLGRHPSSEVVRALANGARTDRSPEVRRACVEGLGQCQTPEALDALLAIAKATDGPEQRAAYDALGEEISRRAPNDIP